MNDLITITEVGQQMNDQINYHHCCKVSGMLKPYSTCNLEFRSPNRKFWSYTIYENIGQLKVNNNRVMWQISMKLPAMFDQNHPHTFDKIVKKLITTKNALKA